MARRFSTTKKRPRHLGRGALKVSSVRKRGQGRYTCSDPSLERYWVEEEEMLFEPVLDLRPSRREYLVRLLGVIRDVGTEIGDLQGAARVWDSYFGSDVEDDNDIRSLVLVFGDPPDLEIVRRIVTEESEDGLSFIKESAVQQHAPCQPTGYMHSGNPSQKVMTDDAHAFGGGAGYLHPNAKKAPEPPAELGEETTEQEKKEQQESMVGLEKGSAESLRVGGLYVGDKAIVQANDPTGCDIEGQIVTVVKIDLDDTDYSIWTETEDGSVYGFNPSELVSIGFEDILLTKEADVGQKRPYRRRREMNKTSRLIKFCSKDGTGLEDGFCPKCRTDFKKAAEETSPASQTSEHVRSRLSKKAEEACCPKCPDVKMKDGKCPKCGYECASAEARGVDKESSRRAREKTGREASRQARPSERRDRPLGRSQEMKKLSAKLYMNEDLPTQSFWEVGQDEAPILRVSAEQAYGKSLTEPYTDRGGKAGRFDTHWDCFVHEAYGQTLIGLIKRDGLQMVARSTKGLIKKTSQGDHPAGDWFAIGREMSDAEKENIAKEMIGVAAKEVDADKIGQAMAGAKGDHPTAKVSPKLGKPQMKGASLRSGLGRTSRLKRAWSKLRKTAQPEDESTRPQEFAQTQPEAERPSDESTMNPSPETEETLSEEPENKLLVTDIILDDLASRVVNGEYTIEEVLGELSTTFSDEELTAEFGGALQEKIDQLEAEVGMKEEGEEKSKKTETPEAEESIEAKEGEELPKEKLKESSLVGRLRKETQRLKDRLNQAERRAATSESETDLRLRTAAAEQLVRQQQDAGLLLTVEEFESQGVPHEAAVQRELAVRKQAIKELVELEPKGFEKVSAVVTRLLKGSQTSKTGGEVKAADQDKGLKIALSSTSNLMPSSPTVRTTPQGIRPEDFSAPVWKKMKEGKLPGAAEILQRNR